MVEELSVLGRGVVIGLMIAAPVGPVGLLCMRRTLQRGLFIGFSTGLGAALADALFSIVAAFGVAQITELIRRFTHSVHLVGGLLILFAAWHAWVDQPHAPEKEFNVKVKLSSSVKSLLTGFFITITNPMTIFGTLAVIAAFGGIENHREAALLVGGIFCGSILWWMMLSGGVSLVREHFSEGSVRTINHATASLLVLIGLWAIGRGIAGNFFPEIPLMNALG